MLLIFLKISNFFHFSFSLINKLNLVEISYLKNYFYFIFTFIYIQTNRMYEEQSEIYQFTISIKQIKLAVKFPCKLTLNHQNKTIKSDVSVNQSGKYIIERQVKAKSQNSQPIEILIHLTTQKGGNIMAGIIKLNPKDLSHSEGQLLTVSLQKCLDQSANCLLKIQRIWVTKNSKAKSMVGQVNSKNRKSFGDDLIGSKKIQPIVVDNYRNIETRSQFPGFNLKKPTSYRKQGNYDGLNQGNKLYGLGPKSYVPEIQLAKSKNLQRSIELLKDGKYRVDDDNKTVGKREIDPSYRLTIQANEKNLKMDIMKYKMKAEQHQKTIQQKNKQLKQLKEQISQLHRQSVQKSFYQQQISSKNQTIQKLQDTSKQLNKQNNRLETKIIQLQRALDEAKSNLQSGMQRAKDEKQRREMELGKQLTLKKDEISLLGDELKSKNNQILRIKKIIDDLQKSLESKTFDYQRAIQSQRSQMSKLQLLLNDKIKTLQQMNKSNLAQKDSLQSQLKKKTQQIAKLQSNTNHLITQLKEVTQLQKYYATYKVKFTDLQKAYDKLQQQKKQVQKHYLKLMQTKQKDYGEFKEQQSGLITSYKRKNTQLTQKTKQQSARILQLQNKTTLLITEMDKLKRTLQQAQKQLVTLTQNWKSVNQAMKQKDQQLLIKHKQLSQLQSKLSQRESLMKKDIQYKTEQLSKVSTKLAEYQHLYRQQKESNETLRFQATKLQGKNKLQQEIISRLNRQIQQTKLSTQKRQQQYKQEMKQLNQKIKLYEQMQKRLNKQLTDCDMQQINRKNQINRLSKQLQIRNQKIEKLVKKNLQHQHLIKQINQQKNKAEQYITHKQRQLKDLQNNKKALEADFTKTQKIKTIIVQEKTSVQNQLTNLKRQIQTKTNNQLLLNKEIKQLKQDLAKVTLKANNSVKDYQAFKQNLYATIQGSLYSQNGNSFNKSFNFSNVIADSNSMPKDSPPRMHRRYTSTSNINNEPLLSLRNGSKKLSESDVLNNVQQRSFTYEPRFNEIIQSYGRQSQQIITQLSDSVKKYKSQIQRLQRQSSNLSNKLNSVEQQSSNTISNLQNQIHQLNSMNQESHNKWDEKLLISDRANRQKQQVIEELNDQLEAVHHQMAANARTYQIQLEQLALKIQQLKAKIYDLEAKNDFSSMTILSYEEKVFTLESNISQISEQFMFEKQKVQRKDKLLIQHTSRIEELNKFIQESKKQRLQLTKQLAVTQQKFQTQKQSNSKNKRLLLQQEQKNKQIKGFNNNLLKQKQSIVKNQLIKSQKVMELEDIISRLRMEKQDIFVQSQIKSKTITDLKTQNKRISTVIKENQQYIQDLSNQIQKLNETIKDKQKRIQQKQLQIKNLQINLQKLITKYDQDTKKINNQHQETVIKYRKQLQEKQTKILQLTSEVEKLSHLEKKLSQQNISLQEQIFFQKQTNSLANSRFELMNRDIDDNQSKLSQAIREIQVLNEEIRDREEKMFELSNKLYAQDNKIEMKDMQLRQKLQKLDIDWKNKFQQTLQDYEAKIESYERQKHYLRTKLEQEMQEISKLQNDKRNLIVDEQKQKKIFEDKIKKIQNEKLALLVEKNKQIERIRQQIETMQDRVKQIKHQKDIKQDDIRRLQQKIRQKQQRLISHQDKSRQAIHQLQKQLQFQKKKQSQLSKYKQFIKNNIWSSEREIKRILQSSVKNIMGLCEQEKKKDVIDIVRNVEGQIVKAIEFNLQEV